MKTYLKIIGVAALVLATVCLQPAFANGSPNSFNITNTLNTVTTTSWPTNGFGTNGLPLLTGKAVAIGNQEHIGLNFQGLLVATNTTASTVTFVLVTGMSGTGNGAVTFDTNGVPTSNDFDTGFGGTVSVAFAITPVVGTNWINLQTNFPPTSIFADANSVGVYSITPALHGNTIQQAALYANKKLIPTPLIGQ